MSSWKEIQEYVRRNYKLQEDDPDWFSIIWADEDDGDEQQVIVSRFSAFDMDWVEFRSYAGPGNALTHEAALRRNEELALGALALDEDNDYVVVYSTPLDAMDTETFEIPLRVIPLIASDIEDDSKKAQAPN
jgi:hypothetical protein